MLALVLFVRTESRRRFGDIVRGDAGEAANAERGLREDIERGGLGPVIRKRFFVGDEAAASQPA